MDKNSNVAHSVTNSNLRDSLDKLAKTNFAKRVHVAPGIPEKQLRNATESMGVSAGSDVLVLVDDSLTKSGKAGICVTNDGIYWKKLGTKGNVKFGGVKQFDTKLGFLITFKINGQEIPLGQFSKEEINPFADFLLDVVTPKRKQAQVTKKPIKPKIEKTLNITELTAKKDVEGLIKALRHKRAQVRQTAARALGEMGDERAVKSLIRVLNDSDEPRIVRRRAAEALGNIGDERAVAPLTKSLEYYDDIGRVAKSALAKISGGKFSIKRSKCPICGIKLDLWEGRKLRCDSCGADLKVEQGQLVEIVAEKVTESPVYEVTLPIRRNIQEILSPVITWPTFCCLCLRPVEESNFYNIAKTEYTGTEFTGMGEYKTYYTETKLKIPYCKDCRHKVRKFFGRPEQEGVSISSTSLHKITLKFRNPLYAEIFREANMGKYGKSYLGLVALWIWQIFDAKGVCWRHNKQVSG